MLHYLYNTKGTKPMILFFLFRLLPATAVLSLILYLPVYLCNRKKYGKRPFVRHLSIYIFIGVLLSLLYATILIGISYITFKPSYYFLNLKPFTWINETYSMGFVKMIKELILNIIMLIPLGFILPIVFKSLRKCWKTVLSVMVIIACIETFQYFIGRSADVDDLIMNTIGGLVGYGIFALLNKCLYSKEWWQKVLM